MHVRMMLLAYHIHVHGRYIHEYKLENEAEFQSFIQSYTASANTASTTTPPPAPSAPFLSLPISTIVFVNSHETLTDARQHLCDPSVTIVGLDVERLPDGMADGIW